jgi:hypothetical protein
MRFCSILFLLSFILTSGSLLSVTTAQAEELKVELNGNIPNVSGWFLTTDHDSNKAISMGGAVGYFFTKHFEPVLDLRFSHLVVSGVEYNYESIHTKFFISPGISYNFSEDTRNSFVFTMSPNLSFIQYSYKDDYDYKFISKRTHDETRKTYVAFGVSFNLGKRFEIFKTVSWYPNIGYSYTFKTDKLVPTSTFWITPISLSIFI